MLTLILTQIFNLGGFIAGVVISVLMIAFNRTITGKSYIYPLIPGMGKCLRGRYSGSDCRIVISREKIYCSCNFAKNLYNRY